MQDAARSTSEADRERQEAEDEVERRQLDANRTGRRIASKTGGGLGRRAPDQVDPDEVVAGKDHVLLGLSVNFALKLALSTEENFTQPSFSY